jgi:hypothetical protein
MMKRVGIWGIRDVAPGNRHLNPGGILVPGAGGRAGSFIKIFDPSAVGLKSDA